MFVRKCLLEVGIIICNVYHMLCLQFSIIIILPKSKLKKVLTILKMTVE